MCVCVCLSPPPCRSSVFICLSVYVYMYDRERQKMNVCACVFLRYIRLIMTHWFEEQQHHHHYRRHRHHHHGSAEWDEQEENINWKGANSFSLIPVANWCNDMHMFLHSHKNQLVRILIQRLISGGFCKVLIKEEVFRFRFHSASLSLSLCLCLRFSRISFSHCRIQAFPSICLFLACLLAHIHSLNFYICLIFNLTWIHS